MESQEIVNAVTSKTPNIVEKKKTLVEYLNDVRKNTTVEPAAFLIIFSSYLSSVAALTMGLQKVCRVNLRLDDEICDALRVQNQTGNFSEYEKIVQEYYSSQLVWRSALQTIFPCIMLIFVGGWSDATGRRKAIMLLCISGEILQSLNNITNVIFFDQINVEIYMFFEVFFVGIVGGTSVMFLAMFNFICDITNEEDRTYRLGFLSLCTSAGMPLGLALSGVVLYSFGYYAIYCSSCTLYVINFLYVTYMLSDMARSEEQKKQDGRGVCHLLKTFFNPATITNSLQILWKKTENNRRIQLFILLFAVTFLYGPVYGEASILFLATRYRFNWTEVTYSTFQTYSLIVGLIGSIILLILFSKYLQWHDTVLGITATSSKILSSFVYCFAKTTTVFFLGPIADILSGTMIPLLVIRSLYSKLLEPHEIGKMTSIIGLLENLTPSVYVPMYTTIYTSTMDTLPGAVFLFGAIMTTPALLSFMWLFFLHKKEVRREKIALPCEIGTS